MRATKKRLPGHIRGFDVKTGKLVWTFHMVPRKGEYGLRHVGTTGRLTMSAISGTWTMMSVDP